MDALSSFSLEQLTNYKENSMLEVKSARGGLPNALWASYSAFANSEGGIIVLGVKENTNDGSLYVEGIDNPHKLLKDFWNIVNNRQKVSCNILTDSMAYTEKLEGKDVIVIRVPRAERTSRPVYIGPDPRTGTYRRNFEGDYHCSTDEVSLMIRDSALVTDDNKLLTDLDASVFCQDTVKSYRNIFKLVRQDHLWNKENDTIFLRRIGAMRQDKDTGKFHPTAAGLLMFGYEYDIITVFPNYFLDYQENRTNGIYARWTDRITSQSGDWSGNVFDFILKVVPKLQADLKVPFMFKGNYRDENTPLHKTVREAAVNMLANADFYGRRGVVVQKSTWGFKFANPGCMRVSLTEALQDSASDPRNGVMMKMLAMVEYGERAGSGLQGIFKTWQHVYHCDPQLEVTTSGGIDRTTLTLRYEGNQPDVEAMKGLYGGYEETGEVREPLSIQERKVENTKSKGENIKSKEETTENIQESGKSKEESKGETTESIKENGESKGETSESIQKSGKSKGEITESIQENGESKGETSESIQKIGKSKGEITESIQENSKSKGESKGETNKLKVIYLLDNDGKLTVPDVAKLLNLSISGVEKIVRQLKKDGILTRRGSTKAGEWIVKKGDIG